MKHLFCANAQYGSIIPHPKGGVKGYLSRRRRTAKTPRAMRRTAAAPRAM
ncbi:hypothetical protein HMPREF0262_00143 [Clostridium sp. ATCC 29733]|nr:hypothetical protein HMPREF0262_00143 [Clostridium sp. ATCC 29733]